MSPLACVDVVVRSLRGPPPRKNAIIFYSKCMAHNSHLVITKRSILSAGASLCVRAWA